MAMINKKDFDARLKVDAPKNGFTQEADYVVFDKSANLDYAILDNYTLRDFLTKNPVSSYTKLNKTLLLGFLNLSQSFNMDNRNKKLKINSSYRSPEYNKTVVGSSPNSQHCKGNALDIGCEDPSGLAFILGQPNFGYAKFDVGIYDWGIHMNVTSNVPQTWDKTTDKSTFRKVKNFLLPDVRRNIIMGAGLALLAFFFVKRIFN